jgi:nucleotide-binding universal stress UspA family protein
MSADSDRHRDLLSRPLVAVANDEDAEETARAFAPYADGEVLAVSVVEKAGGAVDKAPMEGVEAEAEAGFEILRERLGNVETEVRYGTDVVETLLAAARDHDASAIVFTPREGGRLVRFLTGDVALRLVTEADRPVVSLPVHDTPEPAGGGDTTDADDDAGATDADEDAT